MTTYQMPLAQPAALTDDRSAGKVATSRDAYREHRDSGKKATEQARVVDFITRRGEQGATSHEIEQALELGPQSVSGRCNELMRSGQIGRRGDRRSYTKKDGTTVSAFVWRSMWVK